MHEWSAARCHRDHRARWQTHVKRRGAPIPIRITLCMSWAAHRQSATASMWQGHVKRQEAISAQASAGSYYVVHVVSLEWALRMLFECPHSRLVT